MSEWLKADHQKMNVGESKFLGHISFFQQGGPLAPKRLLSSCLHTAYNLRRTNY
ncbi:MAG: hypothetical protein ACJAYF_000884 [Arenicella sp.]|jgi:hypothetical protein